jgi:hypothetical protein
MSSEHHDPLEPPPELDRIIIGNARKAIQGAKPAALYRAPKWALSTGLAVTVVISLAMALIIALHLKHQNELAARSNQLVADAPQGTVAAAQPVKRIKLPAIPTQPWPPAVAPNSAPHTTGVSRKPSVDKARNRLARVEVAASRSRLEAESMEAGPSEAPAPAASAAQTDYPAASTWLGQIEKLRGEGRTAEAEQEIKRFREAYPTYPAPHDAASTAGRAQ